MQRTLAAALLLPVLVAPASDTRAAAHPLFQEGTNYVLLTPSQPTTVPAGTVEVMEVFSYACIACNGFQPLMERLQQAMPPNARVVLLPASFNPNEDWAVFQRAYLAARSLGIAERTHQAMFDAIWKTGELSIMDPATHRLKQKMPSLADVARWYARVAGVDVGAFFSTASSFIVEMQAQAADDKITAMQVPGTPCIVVNGKYRILNESLHDSDEWIELVKYLVAKESH